METITLALAGDVMLGRGIDQVLPAPLPPTLHEPWVRDARDYVHLAERVNGPIGAPRPLAYPWGEALAAMQRLAPAARIVNLETAVTRSAEPWPGKGIHYRMNPAHVGCLQAGAIDACVLANNHVLDWGRQGLTETLASLHAAGLRTAGAGADLRQASAPAVLPLAGGRRLLLFAWAMPSSGVPHDWAADARQSGVALLPDADAAAAQVVVERVARERRDGDRLVVSLHWGGNWVDAIPAAHRDFARRLIDGGAADLVFGHSSHHPLAVEVYRGRLILYGCGDLINDYEGIAPHGYHRADLVCLYAATLDADDGGLRRLAILPFQLQRFRLAEPPPAALAWLEQALGRACAPFGTRLESGPDGGWELRWR
jgi:poly-gamma-glutamate synthesis protein (capsule biosynthesis protein)